MTTNTAGTVARQFPWQVSHYIQRGGPNDPVAPSSTNAGGILSFNGTIIVPPVPGTQTPPAVPSPRIETFIGTTTAGTTTTIATNNGGVLLGTIPQGAWLMNLELYCLAALSGGTSTTVGFYAVTANASYPQAAPTLLAYITAPSANVLYSLRGTAGGATAFTASPAGTFGPVQALSNDVEIYAVNYLLAGSGTINTAGNFVAMIEFTGLNG